MGVMMLVKLVLCRELQGLIKLADGVCMTIVMR